MASPFRVVAGALRIRVRLTPRAALDRVDGRSLLSDGTEVLAARVRAAPEAGAANAALERLIAGAFGRPRSAVRVARGGTARLKEVEISGDPAALLALAERAFPPPAG
ncbi:MAG: DUF167 domain-containing protein [Bauldia sp.]|nr:DUF167 domain-containing protein [Bauldia sp.]